MVTVILTAWQTRGSDIFVDSDDHIHSLNVNDSYILDESHSHNLNHSDKEILDFIDC